MHADAFLAEVRARLAHVPRAELPAELPPTMVSGASASFERFAAELGRVGGEARLVDLEDLAGAVAEAAAGSATAVVSDDVAEAYPQVATGLTAAGCEAITPGHAAASAAGFGRDAASAAGLGVTGAEVAVAATGSVLLASGSGRPRTHGLLPPTHLVVLAEDRLVGGFEELVATFPRLAAGASQLVLVTGPSRTSDIEMTSVRGVHGPERVIVLVVRR